MLPYPFGHGSHAEFVIAPVRALTRKTAGIDHTRAGALPLVSLTAWQASSTRACGPVADLAEQGRLRATIAGTFPVSAAAEAHASGDKGRTTGKLVLLND